MITETGWRHSESSHPSASDNVPQPLPDTATIAQYIDLAFYGNNGRYPQYPSAGWTAWDDDPRVMGVVFFALNGVPQEWGHTNWFALDADGRLLDTYAMLNVLGR